MALRTLVWFRGKDLRLSDHLPLARALQGDEVIPLFVLDPFFFSPARARELPHRMQFLLESIAVLQDELAARGSQLLVVSGKSVEVIPELVARLRVDRVVAQRWVEPFARERDRRVQQALGDRFELLPGETLLPPGTLRTGAGKPYSVFSQFARSFRREVEVSAPLRAPKQLPPLPDKVLTP
jgi:deoxyribodipyrimidine photo-lyase